jgi:hypothetical protein
VIYHHLLKNLPGNFSKTTITTNGSCVTSVRAGHLAFNPIEIFVGEFNQTGRVLGQQALLCWAKALTIFFILPSPDDV